MTASAADADSDVAKRVTKLEFFVDAATLAAGSCDYSGSPQSSVTCASVDIGTLTPGKEADIILLRTDRLNVMPMNNAVGAARILDMVKKGIIDPTKVVRTALENASSIACMVLVTEALVADIPEKKEAAPAMPGGGMGGMGDMDY